MRTILHIRHVAHWHRSAHTLHLLPLQVLHQSRIALKLLDQHWILQWSAKRVLRERLRQLRRLHAHWILVHAHLLLDMRRQLLLYMWRELLQLRKRHLLGKRLWRHRLHMRSNRRRWCRRRRASHLRLRRCWLRRPLFLPMVLATYN